MCQISALVTTVEDLRGRYNLLFKLFSIKYLMMTDSPPKIQVISKIWQFYHSKPHAPKRISFFYNLLQNKLLFTKSSLIQEWEPDLQKAYEPHQFISVLLHSFAVLHCIKYWEITQKCITWWYLTPCHVAFFSPGGSPLCWRGYGQVGNLFHILWACKNLRIFW